MHGLPRCSCGSIMFNKDTGKCEDCTNEVTASAAGERVSVLDGKVQAYTELSFDLESLLLLADPGRSPVPRWLPGPAGRFRIALATDLTYGDRLFDPAAAVVGYTWPDPWTVAVDLADGTCREFDQSYQVLIWRPDEPFTPCHECARPLFTRCSSGCRADRERQAYLDRARTLNPTVVHAPVPRNPGSLEAPCFNGTDVHRCILTPVLRSAGADLRDEDIEESFLRLAPSLAHLPEPVDANAFDIAVPTGFCSYTEGWDLTIAVAVLLSCGLVEDARLSSTLLWARVEPDGTLTAPEGLDAQVAANAGDAGYDQLITAAGFAGVPDPDCRLLQFGTLADLLDWAGRP
jgi:hypothetical protein